MAAVRESKKRAGQVKCLREGRIRMHYCRPLMRVIRQLYKALRRDTFCLE
jgi:hypothetical protein